ncbi:hypothetical protein [Amycolatopsis camponoti]|uniref:hypothetical protein n=1 Tax=Amycolatopsis camponoti TaxID=2606593 RepID=UPI0012D722E3|nr:hypothetical protein [Amycolatopsis camponoti]
MQHLILLACVGCAACGVSALALLVFDGRCLTYPGPGSDGCWPVRLHLDQFLPAYGTAAAVLVGLTAGPARLCRRRPIDPVIRLAWRILGATFALSMVLR